MDEYFKLIKKICLVFFLFTFLALSIIYAHSVQAEEEISAQTPEQISTQTTDQTPPQLIEALPQEKEEQDFLITASRIISLMKKLAGELGNIPQEYFWAESKKAEIGKFIAISERTKERFDELTTYLNSGDEKLDEIKLKDLKDRLNESLKGLLEEAHFVIDDSLTYSVNKAVEDKIQPQKLRAEDVVELNYDENLDPIEKIQKGFSLIQDSYELYKLEDPEKYEAAVSHFQTIMEHYSQIIWELNKLEETVGDVNVYIQKSLSSSQEKEP